MKNWTKDWIEVFQSGEHTDSAGNKRQWTNEDLDAIVSKYDSKEHEAPVVIGHPQDNHPAYAWVEKVKNEGGKLKVKLKKVLPEFKKWVDEGLYRKISVALSSEFGLRHVGFLGAVPPAVKGLCNAFENNGYFETIVNKNSFKNFNQKGDTMENLNNFAEQIKEKDAQITELLNQNKNKEFSEFAQNLSNAGIIPKAYNDMVVEVLHSIKTTDNCFSSSSSKDETLEKFMHFLSNLKPMCEFSELATRANIPSGTMRLPEEDLGVRMANSIHRN